MVLRPWREVKASCSQGRVRQVRVSGNVRTCSPAFSSCVTATPIPRTACSTHPTPLYTETARCKTKAVCCKGLLYVCWELNGELNIHSYIYVLILVYTVSRQMSDDLTFGKTKLHVLLGEFWFYK